MFRRSITAPVLLTLFGFGANSALAEVITIQISPNTINLNSDGEWVTVHAEIPYYGVVTSSVTLNGVVVVRTKADLRGELVAKFAVDDVKDIVSPGRAELVLSGVVDTPEGGQTSFTGSDTIRVVKEGKE